MGLVIFPEFLLPPELVVGERRDKPKDFIANPKAIAAQTFVSSNCQQAYFESRCWEQLAPFFSIQFLLSKPPKIDVCPDGNDRWIAFPWARWRGGEARATGVWLELAKGRRYVRHVRLYTNPAHAAADNQTIERLITL